MPKNIFVSYSRRNYDFADKLVMSLREDDLEVWFDYHLLSGEDWDDSLEEQIRKCDGLIVILSKPSVASDNVKNEVRFAMDLGKQIHPVLLEECSVPLSMRRMHYVDFTRLDYEDAIGRLVNDIKGSTEIETEQIPDNLKSEKPKTKYLVIALIGVLILLVLSWQFRSKTENNGDNTNSEKPEVVFKEDINWRKITTSSEVNDYVNYIVNNQNNEGRLDNAVAAIQDLLKTEGAVIMKLDNTSNWFSKFASKGTDGYVIDSQDTNNTELPGKGDLLVVQRRLNIVDPETFDVIGGIFLSLGDIVQFSESTQDQSHTMWTFYYKSNNLAKD